MPTETVKPVAVPVEDDPLNEEVWWIFTPKLTPPSGMI